jgi:flagellar biosynthesis protein FlhG
MNPLQPFSPLPQVTGDASSAAGIAGIRKISSSSNLIDDSTLFDGLQVPESSRVKQVWAVGGGKGGVGKSLIASSLSIALSRLGKKVTAIDLDLGGSNLHTALGVELPKVSLSDFLNGGTANLQDLAVPSGIPQLEIISGAQDSMGVTQIDVHAKRKLLESVADLDSDYVMFDLGAGTSFTTLDFFLYADLGVIVLLPEPTSIENAYRFIKSSYYRHLWHAPALREIRPLIEMAMEGRNERGIRSPSDLFREVSTQSDELAAILKLEIGKFRPKLLVNQARTQADIDIGFSVKSVCRKYFGIDMDYVGYLDYDSAVWQAIRRKRPLFIEFPNSRLVSSMERVVQYLVKNCMTQRSGIR